MSMTMIKIRKETAEKLKSLKEFERQTYDDVISQIISSKAGILEKEDIAHIEAGLRDIKEGRTHSSKEVARRLGIN